MIVYLYVKKIYRKSHTHPNKVSPLPIISRNGFYGYNPNGCSRQAKKKSLGPFTSNLQYISTAKNSPALQTHELNKYIQQNALQTSKAIPNHFHQKSHIIVTSSYRLTLVWQATSPHN